MGQGAAPCAPRGMPPRTSWNKFNLLLSLAQSRFEAASWKPPGLLWEERSVKEEQARRAGGAGE